MSICLTMIVRNEAPVIARALRSALPFIDSYSIADTGSTDDTKTIVEHKLADIHGILASDKWEDFSTNRNLAMSRATGDWIFILDADETLEGDLVIPDGAYDAFAIQVKHANMEFWSIRVLKNDGSWKYQGVVHEHPQSSGDKLIGKITSCRIVPLDGGHQTVSGNKFIGHLALFEKAPVTDRNVFYHANTLRDLGRTEEAIAKYRERIEMGGWPEEVYISLFEIAKLSGLEADYRAACEYRPHRCEARVELCQMLRNQERYADSYALALEASPSPINDALFIDPNAGWRLLEETALAAWNLGMTEFADNAFRMILKCPILPDDARQRTEENIIFSELHKKQFTVLKTERISRPETGTLTHARAERELQIT